MSLFHASDRMAPALDRQAAVVRFLPFLYGLTLFASALLLFSIQPMFAKMVLPKLGGAPAVWSVAMVFFQTVLLAGLCVRSSAEPRAAAAPGCDVPSGVDRDHSDDAADRDCAGMGCSTIERDGTLAVWTVCGLHRGSVLYAIGQRAPAANLVCRERAQAGEQPLRTLRRVQSRLVCRTVRLSRRHRAVPDAEDADRGLVRRICAVCRAFEHRWRVRLARGAGRRAARSAGGSRIAYR